MRYLVLLVAILFSFQASAAGIRGDRNYPISLLVSGDCDPANVPPAAAAAGLTNLAFCAPFDSIEEISTDDATWKTVPPGKKWSTYVGLNKTDKRIPTNRITDNDDGTISVKQESGKNDGMYFMSMGQDGSGYAIPKGTNNWYIESRMKLEEVGNNYIAFWLMAACHLVPYGNCPSRNAYPGFDVFDGTTIGVNWYQHSPYKPFQKCVTTLNTEDRATIAKGWFTTGMLYTDGATTDARIRVYVDDVVKFSKRNSEGGCTEYNNSGTSASFLQYIPEYAIVINHGSHGDDKIRYDYTRVWTAP